MTKGELALCVTASVVMLGMIFGDKLVPGAPTSTYDRPRWKKVVWSIAIATLVILVVVVGIQGGE